MGRIARHNLVNEKIRDGLSEAGCVAALEPNGLVSENRKRPDGLTALAFADGLPLAFDATIVHTCAPSHLPHTAVVAGAAAESAESRKDDKYSSLRSRGIDFRPLAIETLGAFGRSALEVVDLIVERIRKRNRPARSLSTLTASRGRRTIWKCCSHIGGPRPARSGPRNVT